MQRSTDRLRRGSAEEGADSAQNERRKEHFRSFPNPGPLHGEQRQTQRRSTETETANAASTAAALRVVAVSLSHSAPAAAAATTDPTTQRWAASLRSLRAAPRSAPAHPKCCISTLHTTASTHCNTHTHRHTPTPSSRSAPIPHPSTMTSIALLKPLLLLSPTPHPPPPLYGPTRLPPTIAAGLPGRPPRLRPDGLCESCVCEICICGTHHCPPTPRHLQSAEEKTQPPLTSHSRSTFAAPPSTAYPGRARKPLGALHTGGEWHGSSSYTDTFHTHPHSTTLPTPPLPSPPLFDLSLPLPSSTTSSLSYPRHPLPPRHAPRPPSPLTSTGTFIASSTYSSLFSPPPGSSPLPPPPILPLHSLRPPADEDREWVTEVGVQYRGLQGERRVGMRPVHAMRGAVAGEERGEGEAGCGVSEARARYVRHEGTRVEGRPPMDAGYEDDDGVARDMRTEVMREYSKKVRIPSVKVTVAPALRVGGDRFEGSSAMKDSYTVHSLTSSSTSAHREEAKVQWEEDDRTWHTESRIHYQRKAAGPAYVRPVVRRGVGWEGSEGEGVWETESQRRFVAQGDCVRQSWVPEVKALEEMPFEGGSTSHAAFRGEVGGRRELIRPVSALKQGGGGDALDEAGWVTESQFHYQKKEVEACPAVELEERTVKSGHGHQLYEKRVEEQRWRKIRAGSQRSTALW